MRIIIIVIILVFLCTTTVSALEFTVPPAPESADKYLPADSGTFGNDLWYILKSAVYSLRPNIKAAANTGFSLIAIVVMMSILQSFSGPSKKITELVGTIAIGVLLFKPSTNLIQLGIKSIQELTEYGKLLLPVLTAASAAEGGFSSSAALYAGTVFFNTLLSTGLSVFVTPLLYIYMVLSVAGAAIGEELLTKFQKFAKWLMTWTIKIILYTFTGYMGVTRVISGKVDTAAIKATKIAISGMVPVVGGIISDASESILVSAGIAKNTVGISGFLILASIWIGPFLEIGIQYLLIKITACACSIFGTKQITTLINDFSATLGILLAMTSAVCLLLMISTVCFLKGIS